MADDGVWSEPLSQSEFPIPLQSEAVPSHGGCGRAAAATLPADWPHGNETDHYLITHPLMQRFSM
jgi:hypothetical protein